MDEHPAGPEPETRPATQLPGVTTSVDVDADADEVWTLLTDDDERAKWFGGPTRLDPTPGGHGRFTDPDGTRRDALVETVEPERHLGWTWWPSGDDDPRRQSRVDVELTPSKSGTRVTVTEAPLLPVAAHRIAGHGSTRRSGGEMCCASATMRHQNGDRGPHALGADGSQALHRRLLALEIECVLRRAMAPVASAV